MRVLTYHNIGIAPKHARLKTLYVKPNQLRRHIEWIKRLGYSFLKSDDLLKTTKSKGILLTFDDAYLDFWEEAIEIISSNNITAIVFVPAGLVGTYNQWDYEKLKVKKPLMDWWHLRELVNMGIEIGSHTLTHPYLSKISPSKAKEEIVISKKLLEDKLNTEVTTFCYPYGDYNEKIRDMVIEAGYKMAFTTRHGTVEENPNLFEIKRITIFGNDFLPRFLLKIVI